jgi:hypothetical protein
LESHEAEQRALLERHEAERAEQTQRHAEELNEAQESGTALEQRYIKEHMEQTQRHQRELAEVEKKVASRTHLDIVQKLRDTNTKRIMWTIQLILLAAFASLFFLDSMDLMRDHPWLGRTLKLVLGSVAGIHFLDLIGVKFVSRRFDRLRMWIARKQERRLAQKLKA